MNELGWQTLEQSKTYYVSSLMFKSMHGLNPHWINNNILMPNYIHNLTTVMVSSTKVEGQGCLIMLYCTILCGSELLYPLSTVWL